MPPTPYEPAYDATLQEILAALTPATPGRADADDSSPVVLSTEDLAALAAIVSALAGLPAARGRLGAAASTSVALSTEDAAKVPALGQALAAASVPVVLTAAQLAQLAPTCALPSDAGGQAVAAAVAVPLAGASRVYTGGVTIQNVDTSLTIYIGPAGVNQTAGHYGRRLLPGESLSLPPIDVATVHAYAASGSPVVAFFGLDRA